MEVLIAVTITSVIGLGVWQIINSMVHSRDRVNELAAPFEKLQKTMLLMERDLVQIINRPVRDIYGDFQPAMSTREEGYALVLTRQGWRNPLGLRRSELQRVAWEYTGSELRRHYWPVLDQGQEDAGRDMLMLDGVQAFDIQFFDIHGDHQAQWPEEAGLVQRPPGERTVQPLPRGVRITLEHEQFGVLTRLFALPEFNAMEPRETLGRDTGEGSNDG